MRSFRASCASHEWEAKKGFQLGSSIDCFMVAKWNVLVPVLSGNYDGAALLKVRTPTSSKDRKGKKKSVHIYVGARNNKTFR